MNKQSRFDIAASNWDLNVERAKFLSGLLDNLLAKMSVDNDMTCIDYGCGTGRAALRIAPDVKHVYALDTSTGMLAELEKKLKEGNITNVTPINMDLSKENFPHGEADALLSIMTMHHVDDIDALLDNIARAIKAGGKIFLMDLCTEDGSFHQNEMQVPHFGFAPELICEKLRARGFKECCYEIPASRKREDKEFPIFLITAEKY